MLKLLGNKIAVKKVLEEEMTNGIIIPFNKEDTNIGIVYAVGPGIVDNKGRLHPPEVAIGDKVVYAPFAGSLIEADGEEYLVINERDIIAIIDS